MTESRRMELENIYTRSLIEAALKKYGSLSRQEIKKIAKEHGASSTRIKIAMTYLSKNKKIWKVGKGYEMRTETAVL